ncbi:hypothetical protein Y032_0669g1362 [Ancylostoma ceylanicum]|uniref:Uncharacterized protein n=1 Tax=Ancylostoma ceylanicum TaxID=53326 RepID=A0A016WHA8_9BILA|nr:hypothetical protein Y032_0669g1362 [Ancylostoma ceylanicum]
MVRAYKSHSEYSKQPGWTMINSSFDRNLFSDGETFDHSGRFYYHKFFFPNGDPCNRGRADMEGELLFLDQTHKCRSSFHRCVVEESRSHSASEGENPREECTSTDTRPAAMPAFFVRPAPAETPFSDTFDIVE